METTSPDAPPAPAPAPASAPLIFRPPRLTAHGLAFLSLTLLAGLLAALLGSQFLYLLFATLLALFLVAATHARFMLRGLRAERTVEHPIFSHQGFTVTLRLVNDKGLPVAALHATDGPQPNDDVRHPQPPEVFVPYIPAHGEAEVSYRARVFGRGWGEWAAVGIRTEAPFGFFRGEAVLACPTRALVYPRILSRVARLPLEALFAPTDVLAGAGRRGSDDWVGLREFRGGDNPRWIHWTASARLQDQWLLREFDSPRVRRVVLLLESRLPEGERRRLARRLENAVTIAASLSPTLVRRAPTVTCVTAGPEPRILDLTAEGPALRELMEALALLRPSPDLGVRDLLRLLPPAELDGAVVVAITLRNEPGLRAEFPGIATISAERPSVLEASLEERWRRVRT